MDFEHVEPAKIYWLQNYTAHCWVSLNIGPYDVALLFAYCSGASKTLSPLNPTTLNPKPKALNQIPLLKNDTFELWRSSVRRVTLLGSSRGPVTGEEPTCTEMV